MEKKFNMIQFYCSKCGRVKSKQNKNKKKTGKKKKDLHNACLNLFKQAISMISKKCIPTLHLIKSDISFTWEMHTLNQVFVFGKFADTGEFFFTEYLK